MRRAALLLLVPLACLAAVACRNTTSPAGYAEAPIVLIPIDTLRADHVGLYGYAAGSTPNLDRLGREGIVFDNAYSHCPLTLPAHASMLTGLLPPRHGVRDNLGFRLAAEHRTLASRFKAAGLRTGGAVSAYVLRSATGIAQGFDFYDDRIEAEGGTASMGNLQRDGSAAVESLGRWVGEQGAARFFAFLHLYEPHSPYAPPERHRGHPLAYDGDVAYADELVGRFLDGLKARGIYDRAIVVVTSDHGEGLKDHGEEERHGMFLYREPAPHPARPAPPGGARAGTRVGARRPSRPLPTLLELAGLPADGMDSASFRASPLGYRPEHGQRLLRDPVSSLPLRMERAVRRHRRPLPLRPRAAPGAVRRGRRGREAQPGGRPRHRRRGHGPVARPEAGGRPRPRRRTSPPTCARS
jgi:arylsulfatase A-like enzyme